MPKQKDKTPEHLRPYVVHGVELEWSQGDTDATGDCPICSRDGKFYVSLETGVYHCWKCEAKGNIFTFIRWLWEESYKATEDYSPLLNARKLLYSETLAEWEVCKSLFTDEWLVPGYNMYGELNQLYRRAKIRKRDDWVWALKATPTLGHRLHGVNLYDKEKPLVYLCEGPWDGMAWYEAIARCRETESGLVPTGNRGRSLLAEANVLAVPGCNVFFDSWLPLFEDKVVVLLFDNDHPRKNERTGRDLLPAGYRAMERVANILTQCSTPPREIYYLNWGERGYDPELKDGLDISDCLTDREYLDAKTHEAELEG